MWVLVVSAMAAIAAALPVGSAAVPSAGALAAGPEAAGAMSVAFFGDSIGYTAEEESGAALAVDGYQVAEYNAVPGYTIDDQYAAISALVNSPTPPDTLIIELGTNDASKVGDVAAFEADVRRVLNLALPRVACVRWFDQKPPPVSAIYSGVNRNAAAFNAALARVLTEPAYRSRAAVYHYSNWTQIAPPATFIADLLHLTGPRRPPVPSSPGKGQAMFGALVRQAAEGCDPALATGRAWDVANYYPEFANVNWAVANGVVPLESNGTFRSRVGDTVQLTKRGEAVTWMWNLAGRPTGAPMSPYTDLAGWDRRPFDWAVQQGILKPSASLAFQPSNGLKRDTMALWVHRYAGAPAVAAPYTWADATTSGAETQAALRWGQSSGVLTGYSSSTYGPTVTAPRTQFVATLRRLDAWLA